MLGNVLQLAGVVCVLGAVASFSVPVAVVLGGAVLVLVGVLVELD
jgi:hypothetical protein